MFNLFKPKKSEAADELANIITCKEAYDRDSIDGLDGALPLFYLRLRNDEREFDSTICLCKSELAALKTIYQVKAKYYTKKVYSLELEPSNVTIIDEIQTTLADVWADEKLRSNFNYRLGEGITPYSRKDLRAIDDKCELIWDMYSREPMCVVKRGDGFVLPKDAVSGKANMPFGLSGGSRGMIDKNGKYGIINTGNSFKNDLNYKLLYPFEYHYIRLDGFGNAEMMRDEIAHGGGYKKLVCTMVCLWDASIEPKSVLLNSTTRDEYITVDGDGLLTQHTESGSSRPYKTIIKDFLKIKPVQDANGLWGYIDKNAQEIIPCQFADWNFFSDDWYTILKENEKYFFIN
ncbi:MAG: WG repeat-containing protein, partial [Campylobacterales bacterium]|nr:WG repeat-containing protein [Campylobacterales bacterium]